MPENKTKLKVDIQIQEYKIPHIYLDGPVYDQIYSVAPKRMEGNDTMLVEADEEEEGMCSWMEAVEENWDRLPEAMEVVKAYRKEYSSNDKDRIFDTIFVRL